MHWLLRKAWNLTCCRVLWCSTNGLVLVFEIPKVPLSSFADYLASGIVFDVNRNDPQKTRDGSRHLSPPKLIFLAFSTLSHSRSQQGDIYRRRMPRPPRPRIAIPPRPLPAMAFAAPSPCALSDCTKTDFSTQCQSALRTSWNKSLKIGSHAKYNRNLCWAQKPFHLTARKLRFTLGFLIVSSTLRTRQAASVAAVMAFICTTHNPIAYNSRG